MSRVFSRRQDAAHDHAVTSVERGEGSASDEPQRSGGQDAPSGARGAARPFHFAVRGYRRAFAGRPSPCRYQPTCSAYALDALETHGALRGLWLTARRLGRCHPWGGHGFDPVPERQRTPRRSRPPLIGHSDV